MRKRILIPRERINEGILDKTRRGLRDRLFHSNRMFHSNNDFIADDDDFDGLYDDDTIVSINYTDEEALNNTLLASIKEVLEKKFSHNVVFELSGLAVDEHDNKQPQNINIRVESIKDPQNVTYNISNVDNEIQNNKLVLNNKLVAKNIDSAQVCGCVIEAMKKADPSAPNFILGIVQAA